MKSIDFTIGELLDLEEAIITAKVQAQSESDVRKFDTLLGKVKEAVNN